MPVLAKILILAVIILFIPRNARARLLPQRTVRVEAKTCY